MTSNKHSALTQALIDYLDCPCTYFAPMADDDPLTEAFREARQRGKEQGFTPVIISSCDEILMECLIGRATGSSAVRGDYIFDIETVRAYRRDILSAAPTDSTEVLERMIAARDEECALDEADYGFGGSIADSDDVPEYEDRFFGYWNYTSEKTMPVIIAEIPTDKPWEIFAWLPFGGWNDCPDTDELMAVSKSWYERFGAMPSVMTHDVLEYVLPDPVPVTDAMRAAHEHFAFCPDVIYSAEAEYTAGILAASLTRSRFWSFWWD